MDSMAKTSHVNDVMMVYVQNDTQLCNELASKAGIGSNFDMCELFAIEVVM